MAKTIRFWTTLGVAAVSGSIAVEAAAAGLSHKPLAVPHKSLLILADASGEGGEGGEGGEAGGEGHAGDRTDYLMDLALVEGHMLVGVELYRLGLADMAKTHMKHPADELFEDIKGHFAEMKVEGFAPELEAVSAAVEKAAAIADVDAALLKLLDEIAESRGGPMEAHEAAAAAVLVVQTAAAEFGAGVKDGKVIETHEFQDAWGFVKAAQRLLEALPEAEKAEHMDELAALQAELAGMEKFFPDLSGKRAVSATASDFAVAASRFELAASAIK